MSAAMFEPMIDVLEDVFVSGAPGAPVTPVVLPKDERMHEVAVEWWYFVAHLRAQGGTERFAIEMTALRLRPRWLPPLDTCYIAIIDLKNQRYVSADRQGERAYDQAAAHLRLLFPAPVGQPGDWRIEGWSGPNQAVRYELEGSFQVDREQRALRLAFVDQAKKPVMLHGTQGVLHLHGLDLGYYSRTRLAVSGGLKIDRRTLLVEGDGWMDHEYGAADLPSSRWTFLAIQLDSPSEELCVYKVERKDGSSPDALHGYLVDAAKQTAAASSVTLTPSGTPWGAWQYPLHWNVTAVFGPRTITLTVAAEFAEQRRVPTGEPAMPYVTFWEGAAKVSNAYGQPVGRAFLEMAGYE